METETFRRVEKKYLLNDKDYKSIIKIIKKHLKDDHFGKNTIMSLYLDTDDGLLINKSLEKPIYKDKIRIRSYGIPKPSSIVYLEIKRKYKGMVAKRRVEMTLKEALEYLKTGKKPIDNQVMNEIDYLIHYYDVHPKITIIYDREGYVSDDLRITIDKNIRYRQTDLDLTNGSGGKKLYKDNIYIMEVKALNAMPLWLVDIITSLNIKPVSFSKYGEIYKTELEEMI